MAEEKKKLVKPKKAKSPRKSAPKGAKGKLPTKRSINLVIVNENKINPFQAILGIVAIVLLAGVFSKFLVYDRIMSVNEASGKVSRLQTSVSEAKALLDTFGDVENTYAHYTQAGMTADELSLVDRGRVLSLVRTLLNEGNASFGSQDLKERTLAPYRAAHTLSIQDFDAADLRQRIIDIGETRKNLTSVKTWSVSGNTLTVEITGGSLEKLNMVARRLETSAIVDSVTISTANKQGQTANAQDVWARLIIYLMQPAEEANDS